MLGSMVSGAYKPDTSKVDVVSFSYDCVAGYLMFGSATATIIQPDGTGELWQRVSAVYFFLIC